MILLGLPAYGSAAGPSASTFSQEVRGAEVTRSISAHDHDQATRRSRVLTAPRRFDLAGLGGELHEVELRARRNGGEWTEWTHTANGDPVWFGGMDQLQLRTHGSEPLGTVTYVDVTHAKNASNAPRRTSAARRAGGDPAKPQIVSRRKWGANRKGGKGCKPRRKPTYAEVKAASVHHTVSAVNYSKSQAKGMVLGICQFHRNGNGWDDIGYNALVDRFGKIYEGRAGGLNKAVQGAHAQGVNDQTSGVAVIGTHSSTPVSKQTLGGLAKWLAWKLPKHGLDTTGKAKMISRGGETAIRPNGERFRTKRIIGHRKTNHTECPGNALFGQLSELREKTQRKIDKAR